MVLSTPGRRFLPLFVLLFLLLSLRGGPVTLTLPFKKQYTPTGAQVSFFMANATVTFFHSFSFHLATLFPSSGPPKRKSTPSPHYPFPSDRLPGPGF